MEGVEVLGIRADPSAGAGSWRHFCTRSGFGRGRKLVDYKLFLVIMIFGGKWHFFPHLPQQQHTRGLWQHINGAPYQFFLSKRIDTPRSEANVPQMHTAKNYMVFPTVFYAVADNHTPAGSELQHRLPMFFTDSPHVTFLLHRWYTSTSRSYVLCCCATLLLAVISVLLKGLRRKLENLLRREKCTTFPPYAEAKEGRAEIEMIAQTPAADGAALATAAVAPAQGAATAYTKHITAVGTARTTGSAESKAFLSAAGHVQAVYGRRQHSGEIQCKGKDACRLEQVGRAHKEESLRKESAKREPQDTAVPLQHSSGKRPHPTIPFGHTGADVQGLPQCSRAKILIKKEPSHQTNAGNAQITCIKKAKCAGLWIVATVHDFPAGPNTARAIAAFCNYSVDYVLMLLAMTFNVGIVVSLFAGIALGFLLIGHHLIPPPLQTQAYSLQKKDQNHSSGDNARERVAKRLPADGCRNLSKNNSTTKTSGSTTLEAESHKIEEQVFDTELFATERTTTTGMPRRPFPAPPKNVYCCTYAGAGGEKRNLEQQDELEGLCYDDGNAEYLNKKLSQEGTWIDNYSFVSFDWDSAPTTTVLAVPAPSGLCDAAIREEDTNNIPMSTHPPAPADTEAAGGATSLAEPTMKAAQEPQLQLCVNHGSDGSRSPSSGIDFAVRGKGSERILYRNGVICIGRIDALAQPRHSCGGTEQVTGFLATPTPSTIVQRDDASQSHHRQQWHHRQGGVGTEFQRRASDCYDAVLAAEDVASV